MLIQGEKAIPAVKRAFQVLDGDNLFGQCVHGSLEPSYLTLIPSDRKIPYILLTNGGGIAEEERCRRLTKQLGVEVRTSHFYLVDFSDIHPLCRFLLNSTFKLIQF